MSSTTIDRSVQDNPAGIASENGLDGAVESVNLPEVSLRGREILRVLNEVMDSLPLRSISEQAD